MCVGLSVVVLIELLELQARRISCGATARRSRPGAGVLRGASHTAPAPEPPLSPPPQRNPAGEPPCFFSAPSLASCHSLRCSRPPMPPAQTTTSACCYDLSHRINS